MLVVLNIFFFKMLLIKYFQPGKIGHLESQLFHKCANAYFLLTILQILHCQMIFRSCFLTFYLFPFLGCELNDKIWKSSQQISKREIRPMPRRRPRRPPMFEKKSVQVMVGCRDISYQAKKNLSKISIRRGTI